MSRSPLFVPRGQGIFEMSLDADERSLLCALATEGISLLDTGDESMARLFPDAYPDDPAADAGYRSMMGADLLFSHRSKLEALCELEGVDTLDTAGLDRLMGALEVLRLVIGTRLGITQDVEMPDPDDPAAPAYMLYGFLTWLQGEAVEALASGIPDAGIEDLAGSGG